MALPRLSASRSKKEFLDHLGISESDEDDRRLYRDMMDEAAMARERMCQDNNNLTPQARGNPDLRPPYSSNMIMESAFHREVQMIFRDASPRTKRVYEQGVYQEGRNWDNWVIRWCLWHVFRYRDDRNRNRGQRNSGLFARGTSDGEEPMSPISPTVTTTAATSPSTGSVTPTRASYDPVRNAYR